MGIAPELNCQVHNVDSLSQTFLSNSTEYALFLSIDTTQGTKFEHYPNNLLIRIRKS